MAMTNAGFDGTVDESQFARMMATGAADGVDSSAAWLVSQGTGRQVSVAAQNGWAFAAGVVSRETVALTLTVPTPTTGAWHVVVRNINWSTNTVTIALRAGAALGSVTPPATPPTTLPGTVTTNPGVSYDQPLAWVFVNSANTTLTIFDLRKLPLNGRLLALEDKAATIERVGPVTPTLVGSWTSVSGQTVMYERRNGIVFLSGRATGGNGVIFNLPAGFRPNKSEFWAVISGGATPPVMARVFIEANGNVSGVSGTEPNLISVSFPALG